MEQYDTQQADGAIPVVGAALRVEIHAADGKFCGESWRVGSDTRAIPERAIVAPARSEPQWRPDPRTTTHVMSSDGLPD